MTCTDDSTPFWAHDIKGHEKEKGGGGEGVIEKKRKTAMGRTRKEGQCKRNE